MPEHAVRIRPTADRAHGVQPWGRVFASCDRTRLADPARALPGSVRLDSRQLALAQPYDASHIVQYNAWIGAVVKAHVSYIIYFFDGAVCYVPPELATSLDLETTESLAAFFTVEGFSPGVVRPAPPFPASAWSRGATPPLSCG